MRNILFLPISIVAAFLLMAWVPSIGTAYIHPPWVFLVLCYWVLRRPGALNFVLAFILGLMLDVHTGGLLGAHALAMTLSVFILLLICSQIRSIPLWVQAPLVLTATFFYQVVLVCVNGFVGASVTSPYFWFAPVTAAAIWCIGLLFSQLKMSAR